MSGENTHSRDWKTYAEHYFESGKKNKEYIDQAAACAQNARDEMALVLSELKEILWEIDDRKGASGLPRDPSAALKKKTGETVINIILALFFIVAGIMGLSLGTMSILSFILLIIGIVLAVFQVRSLVTEAKGPGSETAEEDIKVLLEKKEVLDRKIGEKDRKSVV